MAESIRNKTVSGLFWTFLESFSLQAFNFVQGIILARLLAPEHFGLISMTWIFFTISRTFINSGFTTALVRKKNRSEIDYSTVYVTNIVLSLFFGTLLYLASPLIANFYNEPLLTDIVKVNAILLFLGSFIATQNTKLSIELKFKILSYINVTATICTGIITILLAYAGYGVWALIYPSFFDLTIKGLLYWHFQHWFPGLKFSWKVYKEFFAFGSRLLASGLLDTLYNNIYPIFIGKFFSATNLGFYSRAESYATLPATTTNTIIQKVSFPVLSSIQDNNETLQNAYRRMIRMAAFISFPVLVGLSVLAKPFVIVLVTEKWEDCIIYLQILCFALMWWPIHSLNLSLLQVKGRSDLFLKLEIIKKIVGIFIIIVSFPFGIIGLCIGRIISSLISLVINTYYTGFFINVGYFKQMKDMIPTIFYCAIMGLIVLSITTYISDNILKLIIGIPLGIITYTITAWITKSSELSYLLLIIKENILKKNGH